MEKRTREIIAVVILAVLLFGATGVAGWYFTQSRHWNVAATNLDDSLGGMEDYIVIAYKGFLALPKGASQEEPLPANWDAFLDDQNRGNTSRGPLWLELFRNDEEEPPAFYEVVESYKEKNAIVLELHPDDPDRYRVPMCIRAGDKWVGVVSIKMIDTYRRTGMYTAQLERMHPDYTIAIVDNVKALVRVIDHYDIVLCITDQGIDDTGTSYNDTLVAQVPLIGYTGAISIAPSNVASVKTVKSL